MTKKLALSIGQYSDRGLKDINQDFHGVCVPKQPALNTKGICITIADGISSSSVSQIASQTASRSFLEDYYCTAESWSVKQSVQRVLSATNSWLYAQNQRQQESRFNKDIGYVCTFTSLVVKSTTAHIFHIGDARVYKLNNDNLELLTQDHRVWLSKDKSYLERALGVTAKLDIDYITLPLEEGDIFFISTDGVYEHLNDETVINIINEHFDNLDTAARALSQQALANGSTDNVTTLVIRIDQLPNKDSGEFFQQVQGLPFPPILEARIEFDGYYIIRELYVSSRSHVMLARDIETNEQVVIKTPSIDCRDDPVYLDRFLMEEWVANRLNNAHVLKSFPAKRKRNFIYIVTEYIKGKTLSQWMLDNPKPSIDSVRNIIEQIAHGLQAFHRQEMLHQDLRPHNVMIDQSGTAKIIDFGSTYVAGINEIDTPLNRQQVLGTVQFTAPEYFLGEFATRKSDLYSLGCIAYQMLCGRLPYGTAAGKAFSKAAQLRLVYQSAIDDKSEIPAWVDHALKRAVHPDPLHRHDEISEFVFELKQPTSRYLSSHKAPLVERNPVLFWQSLSFILMLIIVYLLVVLD